MKAISCPVVIHWAGLLGCLNLAWAASGSNGSSCYSGSVSLKSVRHV